jgi:hypothetical protein
MVMTIIIGELCSFALLYAPMHLTVVYSNQKFVQAYQGEILAANAIAPVGRNHRQDEHFNHLRKIWM